MSGANCWFKQCSAMSGANCWFKQCSAIALVVGEISGVCLRGLLARSIVLGHFERQ